MPVRGGENRIHVGRLPVQMHRDDAHGARRDRGVEGPGVHRHGRVIDIHEPDDPAGLRDRLRCCDEGVRNGDYLIARANAEGLVREPERIRAAVEAHRFRNSDVCGELPLESGHLGPADESRRLQRPTERGNQLLLQRPVLCHEVEKGNSGQEILRGGGHRSAGSEVVRN